MRRGWNSDDLDRAMAVAQRAADAAAAIVKPRYAAQDFSITTKDDLTPVTDADRDAETAIREVLLNAYPDHAVFGEEAGRSGDSEFLWLVDPIDGTKSFVRGYPFFSTQIALMIEGEIVVGVSDACAYDERASAVRGGGAFLNGKPIRVSNVDVFDHRVAISTGNIRSLAADATRWQALSELIQRVGRVRGYGDFVHYHLLARGAIDLVIESDLNILDVAALSVIVEEAGGAFTQLDGSPVGLEMRSVLAGPAGLHAQALKLFSQ